MARRRRLAAALRGIGESQGKSGEAVARALRWSPSKVSRHELARTGLNPQDVTRLPGYNGITGSRRALLPALAQDAARKGWREEFAGTVSADYQKYTGLEDEASSISVWHREVVPGLLQTPACARHLISSYSHIGPVTPAMIERLARVRMRRHQVPDREPGARLPAVPGEPVLKRRAGQEPVMHEQLRRLAREADRPNVMLHVLPLDAQHAVFGESFVLFRFGPDDEALLQDVASPEHLRSAFFAEGERDTCLHQIAFQMLAGAAPGPASSRQLILETAESYWPAARLVINAG
jgi:hypothetical protein